MVDSGPPSSIVMSVCLSKCLSVRLSICLSVCLLVSTQTLAKLYLAESKLIQTRVALLIKNFPRTEMHVGRDDIFFPVVKYNYLCADFCSRQFMESWSLLLSWNLRPTFYLIDFYRIYFEIWFNRSDEQKFWIVFQYNFYILWENGNLFWLEIKHWPLNNELIFQKRCFNDKRVFILCFSIPCRLSTVLQHLHVFYIYRRFSYMFNSNTLSETFL